MMDTINNLEKLKNTLYSIAPNRRIVLAFSGGVDSTILLYVMKHFDFDVLAVTFFTGLTDDRDSIYKAEAIAKEFNAQHIVKEFDALSIPGIMDNSKERCFICKSRMFEELSRIASENGYDVVCDGTNADDLGEFRPGLRAKEKYKVKSPIAMSGIRKSEIRDIGRSFSLDIANAPSSPCLLTRFPYGTMVSKEMIASVEKGEKILHSYGFLSCRLRHYGDVARIEVPVDRIDELLRIEEEISQSIKALGFREVQIDMDGLRSGSMDRRFLNGNK